MTISVKFSVDVNGWPMYLMPYRNIAENLNRLSRAHERYRRQIDDRQTDRRQTDGRAIAYSEREREREFTFAKKRGAREATGETSART